MSDDVRKGGALGLKPGTVTLVPHDPEWKENFKKESKRVVELLMAEKIAAELEHIGSTAIPDMPAKPIVDILIGVSNAGDVMRASEVLKKDGKLYVASVSRFGQAFFIEPDTERFHYFVTIKESPKWQKYVGLRGFLSTEPARTAYSRLKESLAKKFPDNRRRYTRSKSSFLESVWKQISSRERLVEVRRLIQSRTRPPRITYALRPSVAPDECSRTATLGKAAREKEKQIQKKGN